MNTSPSPRRSASPSRAKRVAESVLVVGTVLSVAAAFGPLWIVRAGIALAVLAGVVAVVILAREVGRAVARGREEVREVSARHEATLRAEREREREVLDVIDVRTGALKYQLTTLRSDLDTARRRLAVAEDALAQQTVIRQAREELLAARDLSVADLRAQVKRLESEVVRLQMRAIEEETQVLAMPRRMDREPVVEIKRA